MADNVRSYRSKYENGAVVDQILTAAEGQPYDNKLINPWFSVNQRGKTTYSGAVRSLDGWISPSAGLTVTVNDDGTITLATGSGDCYFRQKITDKPVYKNFSLMAIASEVTGSGGSLYVYYTDETGSSSAAITKAGVSQITIANAAGKAIDRVVFTIKANSSIRLRYVELLNRPFPTVGAAAPLDKALELAKCKLYFERISAGTNNLTLGVGSGSATTLYVPIKIAPKRITPASPFSDEQRLNLRYGTSALDNTPTSATILSADNNAGIYTLALTGTFTAGAFYRVGLVAGGVLDFDSEL